MKGTRAFTETIKEYLRQLTEYDVTFAEHYADPDKEIEDCITYIITQVQKSGCNGFEDDEIYSMAVRYYTDKGIKVGKPTENLQIAVNHVVPLTEEEKKEAHKAAIRQYQQECLRRMTERNKPKAKREQTTQVQQPSLFD